MVDHREDLVAERTRCLNRLRWHLHELDPTWDPKARDGAVEMIRTLRVARSGAPKGRTQAANRLHSLVTTAPEELRARLRRLGLAELVRACAALRPPGRLTGPADARKLALRRIARRHPTGPPRWPSSTSRSRP